MIVESTSVLAAAHLTKVFVTTRGAGWLRHSSSSQRAVSDVSFELRRGEVVGIVGESGAGKTTVARMLVGLVEPTSGHVLLRGRTLESLTSLERRSDLRSSVRMIFQDPDAALNPGYTIGFGLARAIRTNALRTRQDVDATMAMLLHRVGLDESFSVKYPDELSGGEKRRIGICRALATDPEVIVADEPLSGLDVMLQERVLALLRSEQEQRQFALLLVSHDLDRVNQVCDRVLVMHGGRIVEQTTLHRGAGPILEQYRHPYSVLLQRARIDTGEFGPPVHGAGPSVDLVARQTSGVGANAGCSFASACPRRMSLGDPRICWETVPPLVLVAPEQAVACHFAHEADTVAGADGAASVAAIMVP